MALLHEPFGDLNRVLYGLDTLWAAGYHQSWRVADNRPSLTRRGGRVAEGAGFEIQGDRLPSENTTADKNEDYDDSPDDEDACCPLCRRNVESDHYLHLLIEAWPSLDSRTRRQLSIAAQVARDKET